MKKQYWAIIILFLLVIIVVGADYGAQYFNEHKKQCLIPEGGGPTRMNQLVATSTTMVLPDIKIGKIQQDLNQVQELQQAVDQGHQPWRQDPQMVLIATLFPDGLANKEAASAVRPLSLNAQAGIAVYTLTSGSTQYHVTVSQPIVGKNKIWFVSDVEYVNSLDNVYDPKQWQIIKSTEISSFGNQALTVLLLKSATSTSLSGTGTYPIYSANLVILDKQSNKVLYSFTPQTTPDPLRNDPFYMDNYLLVKDVTNDGVPEILFHGGYYAASDTAYYEEVIQYQPQTNSFGNLAPRNFVDDGFVNSTYDGFAWIKIKGLTFGLTATPIWPKSVTDPGSCHFCNKTYSYTLYQWNPSENTFVQIQESFNSVKKYGQGSDAIKEGQTTVESGSFVLTPISSPTQSANTSDVCVQSSCWGHLGCNYYTCTKADGSTYTKFVN